MTGSEPRKVCSHQLPGGWVSESWVFFAWLSARLLVFFHVSLFHCYSFQLDRTPFRSFKESCNRWKNDWKRNCWRQGRHYVKTFARTRRDGEMIAFQREGWSKHWLQASTNLYLIPDEITSSPLVKERLGRLAWPAKQGFHHFRPQQKWRFTRQHFGKELSQFRPLAPPEVPWSTLNRHGHFMAVSPICSIVFCR